VLSSPLTTCASFLASLCISNRTLIPNWCQHSKSLRTLISFITAFIVPIDSATAALERTCSLFLHALWSAVTLLSAKWSVLRLAPHIYGLTRVHTAAPRILLRLAFIDATWTIHSITMRAGMLVPSKETIRVPRPRPDSSYCSKSVGTYSPSDATAYEYNSPCFEFKFPFMIIAQHMYISKPITIRANNTCVKALLLVCTRVTGMSTSYDRQPDRLLTASRRRPDSDVTRRDTGLCCARMVNTIK
jgi:hypothetical protein